MRWRRREGDGEAVLPHGRAGRIKSSLGSFGGAAAALSLGGSVPRRRRSTARWPWTDRPYPLPQIPYALPELKTLIVVPAPTEPRDVEEQVPGLETQSQRASTSFVLQNQIRLDC